MLMSTESGQVNVVCIDKPGSLHSLWKRLCVTCHHQLSVTLIQTGNTWRLAAAQAVASTLNQTLTDERLQKSVCDLHKNTKTGGER